MLKLQRQGYDHTEDGVRVHCQHFLDETPPKAFFLNTNLPIPPERRFTAADARAVFDALIPARYREARS